MERKLIVHKSEIMGGIVCFLYMLPSSMYKVNGIVMIQDAVSYICFACFFYNLLRRKKYSSIFWLITFAWVSVGISTVLSGNTNLIASYSKKVIKGVAFISFIDYFLRKKELGFLKVIYTILEIEIIINCITIFLFVKVKSFAPRQIQRRLFAALITLSRKVFRPWHKWF